MIQSKDTLRDKPEIRITTGTAKNRKLKAPEIEGFRAVQEIAKLAVFSMLSDKVLNAVCLDLYSGSGNMGIEALSRGADHCDFVDKHPLAVEAIEANLVNCGLLDSATIIRKDSSKFAALNPNRYDIIFADPFYNDTNLIFLLKNIKAALKNGGIGVFFHAKSLNFIDLATKAGINIIDTRTFGISQATFIN